MNNYNILGDDEGMIVYLLIEEDGQTFYKVGQTTTRWATSPTTSYLLASRIMSYFTHNTHVLNVPVYAVFPDGNLNKFENGILQAIRNGIDTSGEKITRTDKNQKVYRHTTWHC